MNPVAAKIASHPQLDARVTALLPKGWTLNHASAGFRNQGQFIAALHAAHRLNCATCFMQLKVDMTKRGMSLGQAIQAVRHTSAHTATTLAVRAEHDADVDVRAESATTIGSTTTSGSTGSTTTSGSTTKSTASSGAMTPSKPAPSDHS